MHVLISNSYRTLRAEFRKEDGSGGVRFVTTLERFLRAIHITSRRFGSFFDTGLEERIKQSPKVNRLLDLLGPLKTP